MKTTTGLKVDLPVWDIFKEAMMLLWQKRMQVVPFFVPAILLLAFVDWLAERYFADAQGANLILAVVSLLLSVLLATACHQFTLIPESERKVNQVLRLFGRNEMRYLLRAIVIGLIAGGVFFVVLLLALWVLNTGSNAAAQEISASAVAAGLLASIPALYIWGRLSITLPEIALGKDSTLKRAWQLSKGNSSKVVLAVIVIPLMIMLPFFLLFFTDNSLLVYLASVGMYLTSLVSLVALSLAYRFLQEFYDASSSDSSDPWSA